MGGCLCRSEYAADDSLRTKRQSGLRSVTTENEIGAKETPVERLRFKVFPAGAETRSRVNDDRVPEADADRSSVKEVVKKSTLLAALSDQELDSILNIMQVFSLNKDEVWDFTDCLCVILEGQLRTEEGDIFSAGSIMGEVGLLHGGGQTNSCASALVPTRVMRLTREAYSTRLKFTRQNQIKTNVRLLDSIPLFSKLSFAERLQIADVCTLRIFGMNDIILREGDRGQQFCVLRTGEAEVIKGEKRIDYKYAGDYFGERALIENAPRSATIVSRSHATEVLCLDVRLFHMLLGSLDEIQSRSENAVSSNLLVTVPLFSQLSARDRHHLQQHLKKEDFKSGDVIFKQGDDGDKLYIIVSGTASVYRLEREESVEIDQLYGGQYFGERALLKLEPRMATVKARSALKCLSITKADFDKLALQERVRWSDRWDTEDTRDASQLDVLRMMGSGSFGTVWLVEQRRTKKAYALKCLDKARAAKSYVKDVIVREKDLLASLPPHQNVICLLNTYQDDQHLFMLLELSPGGELYQLLRERGMLSSEEARFYTASVTLALRHIHTHNIIFRDLKPENLLLDARGYIKLIDFGFARRLYPGAKAYTLCGTPYYLAPEMILHSGHGKGLDWWTLGVLSFEMMSGRPPFQGETEMDVYRKATRLQYTFPPSFPPALREFVRALLELDPGKRLGNLRNKASDVMAHPWLESVPWDALEEGRLEAPVLPVIKTARHTSHDSGPVRQKNVPHAISLRHIQTDASAPGFWKDW